MALSVSIRQRESANALFLPRGEKRKKTRLKGQFGKFYFGAKIVGIEGTDQVIRTSHLTRP